MLTYNTITIITNISFRIKKKTTRLPVCHDFAAALGKLYWNITITSISRGQTTELAPFLPEISTTLFKSTLVRLQARIKLTVKNLTLMKGVLIHIYISIDKDLFFGKRKVIRFLPCAGLGFNEISLLLWFAWSISVLFSYLMIHNVSHRRTRRGSFYSIVPSKSCALVFLLNPYSTTPIFVVNGRLRVVLTNTCGVCAW